ncbi:putative lysosomal Pro-Xaa carboxypeptidase [Medicago truncatula]|uniref:Putative lysosomal Pro-Xaa carboxypeptidase n=1 Tax=Medicago truncatula TaxID=3880 RepID=A0A396GZ87_MEDTR|nr:putative lysosomal Pro-Xaa carboxypeptidase [Medicago truncatula]
MNENSAAFKALLVYIEHRYYGKSVPFESREETFKNASSIGYFSSAQTLEDYAEVLIHIKKTLDLYPGNSCRVISNNSYTFKK